MPSTYLAKLLAEGEEVLLETRHHGIVLAAKIGVPVAVAVLLAAAATYAGLALAAPVALLGYLVLFALVIWIGLAVARWRSDRFVVTNRRVLCLSGILGKSVTDSSLEKVNDVKMDQSLWGRMLDFGDIEILTASELGANQFRTIRGPVAFKKAMLDAKGELESPGPSRSEPSIPDLIAQLDALRKRGALTDEEFDKKKAELLARM